MAKKEKRKNQNHGKYQQPRASLSDSEQLEVEFSHIAAGNVELYNCFEKQFAISCKVKYTFIKYVYLTTIMYLPKESEHAFTLKYIFSPLYVLASSVEH